MMSNARCWWRRLAVLVIATSWLTGCVTADFAVGGVATCPPVVKYSREFEAQAAAVVKLLPNGSAVVKRTGDYALMRGHLAADDRRSHRR